MLKTNLRKYRKEKGMSQLDLAIQTKIATSDISLLENGKKYAFPGWRKRLSKALEVSEDELFPKNDEE